MKKNDVQEKNTKKSDWTQTLEHHCIVHVRDQTNESNINLDEVFLSEQRNQ